MALDDKINKFFPVTSKIIKCYDMLVSLLVFNLDSIDENIDLIIKIKELVEKEFNMYSKLTVNDINSCVKILSTIPIDSLKLSDMRVSFRLASMYDKISNYTINVSDLFPYIDSDVELSVADIVNSKIIIDTYKVISRKLNSLSCYDDKSKFYADRLISLNVQNAIYKLSMRELSELLLIDSMFDIDRIPNIDLNAVKEEIYVRCGKKIELSEIVGNKIYNDVIDLINRMQNNTINPDSPVSIYDNLFGISYLEVLFDYLSKEQLKNIISHYENISMNDKIIANNIKRLIRNKIDR